MQYAELWPLHPDMIVLPDSCNTKPYHAALSFPICSTDKFTKGSNNLDVQQGCLPLNEPEEVRGQTTLPNWVFGGDSAALLTNQHSLFQEVLWRAARTMAKFWVQGVNQRFDSGQMGITHDCTTRSLPRWVRIVSCLMLCHSSYTL